MYPQSVLSKNKKNIKIFLQKIFNFYNLRKTYLLHGRVFVMITCITCVKLNSLEINKSCCFSSFVLQTVFLSEIYTDLLCFCEIYALYFRSVSDTYSCIYHGKHVP